MSGKVFISYSRWNKPFADRLKIDLERAGLTVWLDTSDILAGRSWREEIAKGIEAADWVVLLASPESGQSPIVRHELAYAQKCGKPVIPLLIGGVPGQLPEAWSDLQLINFTRDEYWFALAELFRNFATGLTAPAGYVGLLGRANVTVAHAAGELRGSRTIQATGRDFVAVPLGPTGYTTSWLIGPADEPFVVGGEVAWLLHFSGPVTRNVDQDVLEYLASCGHPAWVVGVEGPRNMSKMPGFFDLSAPHVWTDAIEAAVRTFDRFLKGKHVRMFMNSPVQVGFAVGGRTRDMYRKYELYHYTANSGASGKPYELVYERGRT